MAPLQKSLAFWPLVVFLSIISRTTVAGGVETLATQRTPFHHHCQKLLADEVGDFYETSFLEAFEYIFSPLPEDKKILLLVDLPSHLDQATQLRMKAFEEASLALKLLRTKYPERIVRAVAISSSEEDPLPSMASRIKIDQPLNWNEDGSLDWNALSPTEIETTDALRKSHIFLAYTGKNSFERLQKLIREKDLQTRGMVLEGGLSGAQARSLDPALLRTVRKRARNLKDLFRKADHLYVQINHSFGIRDSLLHFSLKEVDLHIEDGDLSQKGSISRPPFGQVWFLPPPEPALTPRTTLHIQHGETTPEGSVPFVGLQLQGPEIKRFLLQGSVSKRAQMKVREHPGLATISRVGLGLLMDQGISAADGKSSLAEHHNSTLGFYLRFGSDRTRTVIFDPEFQKDVRVEVVLLHLNRGLEVELIRDGTWTD